MGYASRSGFARCAATVAAVVTLLAAGAAPGGAASASPPSPVTARLDPVLAGQLAWRPSAVSVIVQFRTEPTVADAEAMRAAGFAPGMTRYTVVPAVHATGPATAVEKLLDNPRVTYVEADRELPYLLDRATVVTRARPLWDAVYKVAGEVHTNGITGRGVGIAIVDSGIDGRHPDLRWKPLADELGETAKTVVNVKVLGGTSFEPQDFGVPVDFQQPSFGIDMAHTDALSGHGTHVAGIAAGLGANSDGRYAGVAPGANLIGIGAGDSLAIHSALGAYQWIHDHHEEYNIRVANNSFGGPGEYNPDLALTRAMRRAIVEDGIVLVTAAGNSGGDGSEVMTNVWGNIPEAISVANYYDGTGWLDSSSSRGARDDKTTWPDVAAPGTQIVSTAAAGGHVTYFGSAQDAVLAHAFDYEHEPFVVPAPTPAPTSTDVSGREVIVGEYASFTGTSMSSPAVAGVVALVLEANPDLVPAQVRRIIRETANMLPGRSWTTDGFALGRGVVDAAEAVAVALKMREGLNLRDALAAASLDLSGSPAQVNLGTGPVTDNTVPLLPPPPPTITASMQMFHGDAIDPAVLTGVYGFAPAEPVGIRARSITSHDSDEAIIGPGTYAGAFRILRKGELAYGPLPGEPGSDSFGSNLSAAWMVPPDATPGSYTVEAWITIESTGQSYLADTLDFFIGAPD